MANYEQTISKDLVDRKRILQIDTPQTTLSRALANTKHVLGKYFVDVKQTSNIQLKKKFAQSINRQRVLAIRLRQNCAKGYLCKISQVVLFHYDLRTIYYKALHNLGQIHHFNIHFPIMSYKF